MPSVSKTNPVIAICCSDIHLSHKPPVARAAEKDWYAAMRRPLIQICKLMGKYSSPAIIAGDIFDCWNSPAELINFALEQLPECYAVPGQHDLANHNYSDVGKTAYGTLVLADVIHDMAEGTFSFLPDSDCWYFGFPWGAKICSPPKGKPTGIKLAVVHAFCYRSKNGYYPGVDIGSHCYQWEKKLRGFDVAIFGDNHSGFLWERKTLRGQVLPRILNCGTLMRRKFDEINYKPAVGLLHADGTITRHFLDCSKDKFSDFTDNKKKELMDMSDFLEEMKDLGDAALDFREAVNRAMAKRGVSKSVRKIILRAMEDEN